MGRLKLGALYKLGDIGTARVVEIHPREEDVVFAMIHVKGHTFDGKQFMFYTDGKRVDNFARPMPDLGDEVPEEITEEPAEL